MSKWLKVTRDANHLSIVKDLKKLGYAVIDLAAVGRNVPDLIVSDATVTALVEVKLSTGWFYLGQLEFLAKWPGVAGFAETLDDALALMTEPEKHRLTWNQKQAILNICERLRNDEKRAQTQPRVTVSKFNKLLDASNKSEEAL